MISNSLVLIFRGDEFLQIVHWKNHLKFPDEARLTPEAKDLICKLLCGVPHRLGTRGATEIKVCKMWFSFSLFPLTTD